MNRIDARFAELKAAGKKGLVAYLTAGDPDLQTSEENVRIALQGGVDVLELGVPFSDPTADGPTIQEAAQRALAAGTNLNDVLAMVKNLRKDFDTPIVLFGYANPFFRYGYETLCRDAVEAGVDGFLVVDIPYEICGELKMHTDAAGLRLIPLIAPTTAAERADRILSEAQGFAYYIMVKGVTGARRELVVDLGERIAALRGVTDLPIAAGFGVSSGEQAAEVARTADAVVVGSALVRAAHEGGLAELMVDLKRGVDGLSE
ncbi:MAG: tryptophan synthase subunit alpha [Kiritimatiellia bacterium]|jgi:tryptophan synthase alpha chain|nr:tryptophan synthase subunit alpha [Kiritimatiellia bacterium]